MVKVNDVVSYLNSRVGTGIDMDGAYGFQCADLAQAITYNFFGWWFYGNAIALASQPIPNGFERIRVTDATQIKAGDIVVWSEHEYAQYGHVAIAAKDGYSDQTFENYAQNWLNASLTVGSPIALVRTNMYGVGYVIRPPYEKDTPAPKPPAPKPDKPNLGQFKGDDDIMFIYYKKTKQGSTEQWFVIGGKRIYLPTMTYVNEANDLIKRYGGNTNVTTYNYDNFGLAMMEKAYPQVKL